MTPAQMTALVTALKASTNPSVVAWLAARNDWELCEWCNADASPTKKAWKTAVPAAAADEACDWTQFDAIAVGKRDSWGFFLLRDRNFSKLKIRKWITDVWGNATANSVAESILQAGLENASNAEVLIGGTDKTTGTVTGFDRTFVGDVSLSELSKELNK